MDKNERTTERTDVNPLTGIARRTWLEKSTTGRRCAAVYSDGSRCRFENGHTQKHGA